MFVFSYLRLYLKDNGLFVVFSDALNVLLAISQMWKVSPYCWRHHVVWTQALESPELDLVWKSCPWGPAFKAPDDIMLASKGEKQSAIQFRYDYYEPWPNMAQ